MKRKKAVFLIIFFPFLVLGGFFVFQKLDFNGKRIIQIKNEQNGEKQIELAGETENSSSVELQINAENSEKAVEKENAADNGEKKEAAKEKTENLPKIINRLVNWGYQESSGRSIDTIIIHSSYNAIGGDEYSLEKLISEYKGYGVSPHYLIDRAGNIYRLVSDENIAYHAGESKTPDGRTGVNNFSVGIEMMNTKSDDYTDSQYNALRDLLAYLRGKYKIRYTLGHSDIAKDRKDDPWNFNWNKIK
jgi:hypothetical protein